MTEPQRTLRPAREEDAAALTALVEGIGRALLERAELEARRAGYDSLALYTHEKMAENLALYARIGYVEYDRRSSGDFSRVFMRKRL